MKYEKPLPEWLAEGIEPPQSKKVEGWKQGDRPPAEWWNWQMNKTYEALEELQEKSATETELNELIARIGNNSELNTEEKSKIILALNEVNTKATNTQQTVTSHLADLAKYAEFQISSNQSIPNATDTQINWEVKNSFNGEDFCELENGRIKITKTGMYEVILVAFWAGSSEGLRRCSIAQIFDTVFPTLETSFYMSVSNFIYATEDQLLNITAYQTSSGALDLIAGGNTRCRLRKVV